MPTPTIYPTMMFDKLDEFLLEFEEHDQMITAGVASVGTAAAYALVWEWGNVKQVKPGPRTVLGTNPDGEEAWLSIQAPFGYIKIHENDYWEILKLELGKVKFSGTNAREITRELEAAAERACKQIAQIISDNAPVDKGDLSKSFVVVRAGSPGLDDSDDDRTIVIGGEE